MRGPKIVLKPKNKELLQMLKIQVLIRDQVPSVSRETYPRAPDNWLIEIQKSINIRLEKVTEQYKHASSY